MYKSQKILGIIPARGSNDEVDHLNIKELGGKPMIYYSIDAILKSQYIDYGIVSTEDEKTAEIAKQAGVSVPFSRPVELISDEASLVDIACHVLQNVNKSYDIVVMLLPNAPFRLCQDIDSAIEFFVENRYDMTMSITEKRDLFYRKVNGKFEPVCHQEGDLRKDCDPIYRVEGGIVIYSSNFLKKRKISSENLGYFIMPEHRARTVSTLYDLLLSERLIRLPIDLVEGLLRSS